jgi:hypothetical protein
MRSRQLRLDVIAITVLVVIQTGVLLLVRPNPRYLDGILVLNYARDFPDVPANHYTLRSGLLLPVWLLEKIFGYGQVSYYLFPFLCSLVLVAAVYVVGKELFGRWAGCLAAVLTIVNPVLIETINFPEASPNPHFSRMTSWQLLPDVPATALFTLGMALLLVGIRRARLTATNRAMAAPGWMVSAGLAFGWSYLIRETIPFLFPLIILVLLLWRVAARAWLWLGATMLACFVFELVIGAAVYGHAFARFTAGAEQGSAPPTPLSRIDILGQFASFMNADRATIAWWVAIGLTVVAPLVGRRREYVVPIAWTAMYFAAMVYLTGVLTPHNITLRGRIPRYWVPLMPAIALGAAGCLYGAWRLASARSPNLGRHGLVPGFATVVVLLAYIVPVHKDLTDNPRDSAWNGVRNYLHAHDAEIDTLLTDWRDAYNLSVYRYKPVGGQAIWHGNVVIVPRLRLPRAHPGQWLLWTIQVSQSPPGPGSGWTERFQRPGLRIYSATE